MSDVERRIDELARTVGGGYSRRTLLRMCFGLVGAVLAAPVTTAWAQGSSQNVCAELCRQLPPGRDRGKCIAAAAQGVVCTAPHPGTLIVSPFCCGPGESCCREACCPPGSTCVRFSDNFGCSPACGPDHPCGSGESCCQRFPGQGYCCPAGTGCTTGEAGIALCIKAA